MPSKRKKNKRRMRRVQAQRRSLEEQHAANPPIKASSGVAINTPPKVTSKNVAKASKPTQENIPHTIPICVHIAESPKVEPEEKENAAQGFQVEVAAGKLYGVLLKQLSPELQVESRVGDEVEGPARVTKEPTIESFTPVEPSTVETDLARKAEIAVSETEPISKVAAPDKASVGVAAETETEDNEDIQTYKDQTHDVYEVDSEKAGTLAEDDTDIKEEIEVPITEEVILSEPVKKAAEQPVVQDLTDDQCPAKVEPAAETCRSDTRSGVEAVTEPQVPADEPENEPAKEPEKVSHAPSEDGEDKLEDLAEEEPARLMVESFTAAEEAFAPSEELPAVLNTITEAPLEEADPPAGEAAEGAADLVVPDLVVNESVSTLRDVSVAPVVQQEAEGIGETSNTQTASMDSPPVDPEFDAAAPTVENAATNQTCLDVSTEEAESGVCAVPCIAQLPVEAVQLSAMELSLEITQNGNIVPEVSIEG